MSILWNYMGEHLREHDCVEKVAAIVQTKINDNERGFLL